MKIFTLTRKQTIPQPRRDVFAFFEKPDNLERITPPSVGFNILTPKPVKINTGTVLDYTIKLFGFSVRWTTLISDFNPPNKFSDVALRGPYSFWHHTHTFEDCEQGTVMIDEVRYALPFGLVGRLAHFLWVKRQLNYIFDYRTQIIGEMLKDPGATQQGNRSSKFQSERNQR